jgi:hypothetical protein
MVNASSRLAVLADTLFWRAHDQAVVESPQSKAAVIRHDGGIAAGGIGGSTQCLEASGQSPSNMPPDEIVQDPLVHASSWPGRMAEATMLAR